MCLRKHLIVHQIIVGHRRVAREELSIHGHFCEDQIAAIGAKQWDLARGWDFGAAVSRVHAFAGVKHEDVSECLVKIINVAKCVEVHVEVIAVV